FDGGDVSGIGGVELLRTADDRLGLCQAVAKPLPDPRNQDLITHDWLTLFRQRIYAIGAGFEDLNDHEQLRLDAALQSAVGVLKPMGSAPTLCRLEAVAVQLRSVQRPTNGV
ncbi:MAG TPA: IS1380 family transposase, partial [Armatimonadetes bacterium]|nr:IS1380 family transposase [Armatimonadota bacterium]